LIIDTNLNSESEKKNQKNFFNLKKKNQTEKKKGLKYQKIIFSLNKKKSNQKEKKLKKFFSLKKKKPKKEKVKILKNLSVRKKKLTEEKKFFSKKKRKLKFILTIINTSVVMSCYTIQIVYRLFFIEEEKKRSKKFYLKILYHA
jgi:hypothetical protein